MGWIVRFRARLAASRLLPILCAILILGGTAATLAQPAAAARFDPTGDALFYRLWARTDLPIITGQASRGWVWGAASISPLMTEPTAGGARNLQYFDKGAMEFNSDPAIPIGHPAFVLSSPLVYEMVTGQLATGEVVPPATVGIAGDADDQSGPVYATFAGLRNAPASADRALLVEQVDRAGNVSRDERLAAYGVTAAYRVQLPGLDHQIAAPFWEYINARGSVYRAARYVDGPMFEDQWSMVGLPLTEAYWSTVKLNGTPTDVLIQVFERRVLTYAPNQPEGWRVQFANAGRHYLDWRHGGAVDGSLAADPAGLPSPPSPDYGVLQAEVVNILAGSQGLQSAAVLDLQTNELISVDGDRRQLAACTIKIPIMIAVARDISAGKYTAGDVEHLVIPAMGPSLTWPARELLKVTGDGDIGAGIRRANEIMRAFGVERSIMTHPPGYYGEEYGYYASAGEVENWLTADDLVRMLSGIWRGDGLTSAERDYVLWSLNLATPFLDATFRAPLPDDAASFHKIGVLYETQNVWNDAGLVVFERQGQEYAYAVAFLSWQNPASYLDGYYLNQSVNQAVWNAFSRGN